MRPKELDLIFRQDFRLWAEMGPIGYTGKLSKRMGFCRGLLTSEGRLRGAPTVQGATSRV